MAPVKRPLWHVEPCFGVLLCSRCGWSVEFHAGERFALREVVRDCRLSGVQVRAIDAATNRLADEC